MTLFLCVLLPALLGAAHAQPADPRPTEILRSIDAAASAFKDLTLEQQLEIFEKGGASRTVSFVTRRKGHKTTVRLTGPSEDEGRAFLFDGRESAYTVFPASGGVRRTELQPMSTAFMGSDVTYEDMAGFPYAGIWEPTLSETADTTWTLDLALAAGKKAHFPKLRIAVDKRRRDIVRLEAFTEGGKKARTLTYSDFQPVSGSARLFAPRSITFVDHLRGGHRTKLTVENATADQGLADKLFRKERLTR